jgi:hypothetical protein
MLKLPHQSLKALAALFYSLANHVHGAVLFALASYGNALAETRKLITRGNPAGFGKLASITALCIFEVSTA